MTNQAIVIVNPKKKKDLLFYQINGKIFLQYQLSYLAENLFKKIIFIDTVEPTEIKAILGSEYLGMQLEYIKREDNCSESSALIAAYEHIDDIYAFVFDAHHYFRLNLGKADDFRRMRDSKLLHIGHKSKNFNSDDLPHIQLNEKGRIIMIESGVDVKEVDTFFSASWLISKNYFTKQFNTHRTSLLELLTNRYEEHHEYCLACRQYFITISSEKDLETAQNDFTEYYYQ